MKPWMGWKQISCEKRRTTWRKFKIEIGISIYMCILLAVDIIKEKMEQLKNKNLFVLTVSEL